MKTSTTTPRTPRKTSSTVAKAIPTEKKVTAPRARRAPAKKALALVVDAAEPPFPTIDLVRVRAYEIYEHRSGQGDAVSDWLQAEQELMAKAG